MDENRNSCYVKLLVEKEFHILNLQRCLRRAWRGYDFRVCKVGENTYQFFFSKPEVVDHVLANGPWHVDNHLLLLHAWTIGGFRDGSLFNKVQFWVRVTKLPKEWCSSRIGKRMLNYFKDCQMVELCTYWGSDKKKFRVKMSIAVDKPLRRFLRAGQTVREEFRGMLKYEKLQCLCFKCGCLGHFRRECKKLVPESSMERFWYGLWMFAEFIAKSSIIWMMSKEELHQEEEETPMLKMLIDQGPEIAQQGEGSFARKT